MRGPTAVQAWLILCVVDVLITGSLLAHMQDLQAHRPVAADALHGFLIRQVRAHSDYVYYVSQADQTVDHVLMGAALAWNVVIAGVVMRYARAARRQKQGTPS